MLVDLSNWHDSSAARDRLIAERSQTRATLDASWLQNAHARNRSPDPVEAFVFLYDRAIYSPGLPDYRIDSFLDDGERSFGGYDQLVLWQPYPRMGICHRDQWQFWQDSPGGIPALRRLVERAHARRTKVLFNYVRWDSVGHPRNWPPGELNENFGQHGAQLAALLDETGADGVYGDTLRTCPAPLRAALDAQRPGRIYESEYAPGLDAASVQQDSWTQSLHPEPLRPPALRWLAPSFRFRFVNRGTDDHAAMIAQAVFWGCGYVVWENVFGWWNPYRARARTFSLRAAPLLRAHADAFSSSDWSPLTWQLPAGLHANLWPAQGKLVVTLLNTGAEPARIEPSHLGLPAHDQVYDAWNGRRLSQADALVIPAGSPAVLISTPRGAPCPAMARPFHPYDRKAANERHWHFAPDEAGAEWVIGNRDGRIHHRKVSSCELSLRVEETAFRTRITPAALVPRPPPKPPLPHGEAPKLDAPVVPAARMLLHVRHLSLWREGGCCDSPNTMDHAPRMVWIESFGLARTKVSRASYQRFLRSSGYAPRDLGNFLQDWEKQEPGEPSTWSPAPGEESLPVTWVDLEDARAFAHWSGGRLPTEEEWQCAAQGPERREWPWGDRWDPSKCNHATVGLRRVDAFPEGAGPFGHLDLAGNAWEWTESERDDGHTRYAILRGGSYLVRETDYWGKMWYAAEGAQPGDAHEKFLLLCPSLDRCPNVSFRCAYPDMA